MWHWLELVQLEPDRLVPDLHGDVGDGALAAVEERHRDAELVCAVARHQGGQVLAVDLVLGELGHVAVLEVGVAGDSLVVHQRLDQHRAPLRLQVGSVEVDYLTVNSGYLSWQLFLLFKIDNA